MASKSKYGKHELEELWVKAGGPKAQARIAAAIALAESKGVPTERNPEGPEHAEGLWQIKGQLVSGNPFNPEVSAENAVAKWKAAKGFTPWTTYTGGEYKKYLGSESPPEIIEGENQVPIYGAVSEFITGQGKNLAEGINKAIPKPLSSVGQFIESLTNPNTWLRLAEGVGGIMLFMIGLKTLTKGSPSLGIVDRALSAAGAVGGPAGVIAREAGTKRRAKRNIEQRRRSAQVNTEAHAARTDARTQGQIKLAQKQEAARRATVRAEAKAASKPEPRPAAPRTQTSTS